MTCDDLLVLLMADLGEPNASASRKQWLTLQLQAAQRFIEREGIAISSPINVEDAALIIMYAAYLVRKRDTSEGMPRMLRWALNNRLFGPKAQEDSNEV